MHATIDRTHHSVGASGPPGMVLQVTPAAVERPRSAAQLSGGDCAVTLAGARARSNIAGNTRIVFAWNGFTRNLPAEDRRRLQTETHSGPAPAAGGAGGGGGGPR